MSPLADMRRERHMPKITPAPISTDRRRFERYALPPMYSRILVRLPDSEEFEWEGHAYDISEGGVRFELDRAVAPGSAIAMRIDLPHAPSERSTARRSVFVFANVVWLEEEDAPGPVRMAAVFTQFAREGDRELLLGRLLHGRYRLAA